MIHRLAVKIFDGLTGREELLSNLLMLSGSFSFLLQGPLLKAAHNMAAGFPRRELADKENEQQGQCHLLLNLKSDMSSFLPCSVGHTD